MTTRAVFQKVDRTKCWSKILELQLPSSGWISNSAMFIETVDNFQHRSGWSLKGRVVQRCVSRHGFIQLEDKTWLSSRSENLRQIHRRSSEQQRFSNFRQKINTSIVRRSNAAATKINTQSDSPAQGVRHLISQSRAF